jgi:hypothetical protein
MIRLELEPEIEAQLAAEARARGLALDQYVTKLVAVLQDDPASHQHLLDLVDEADTREGIRRGLEDVAAGRTRPAHEVFDELREKYRIPR